MKIPYVNFSEQNKLVKSALMESVSRVIDSGHYILGPEVLSFENEFSQYTNSKFAIGVGNGTDALILALRALEIGPGDEVITVSHSFVATVSAISLIGAKPVLIDVGRDFNLDPEKIERAINKKTKAILPVHLTGRPAQMDKIMSVAKKHGIFVIEDCAQAISTKFQGKHVGTFGDFGTFSLHPLKNLHAFGDGGIILTQRPELNEKLKLLRNIGLRQRDNCILWAGNSRLDEIQAAMLKINLAHLDTWTNERRKIAHNFNNELSSLVEVPVENNNEFHTYQTYVIMSERRDELFKFLVSHGVDAKIHYPKAIHQQDVCQELHYQDSDLPTTSEIVSKIISLPCYPGLSLEEQKYIVQTIKRFYET